jgi:hypothetical protein
MTTRKEEELCCGWEATYMTDTGRTTNEKDTPPTSTRIKVHLLFLWKGEVPHLLIFSGCYIGMYKADEREGPGKYIWPDGDRYEGIWSKGGRVGKGKFISARGVEFEQEWNEPPSINYSDSVPAKFPTTLTN